MTRGRVVVIGGGVAGTAAALHCCDAGFEVTVLEARPRLGGVAGSFRRGERMIDTGQHVFLRCYSSYAALLRRLGVFDSVRIQPRFRVPVVAPGGRGWLLRRGRLPAPAHLLPALLGHRALTWRQRSAALRTALALRRLDPHDPALDEIGFAEWLRARREPERTVQVLWGMLIVAALNAEPRQVSLAMAVKVFRTGVLDTVTGGDIGIPQRPLGELHDFPARRALAAAGATVRLRAKALSVQQADQSLRVTVGTRGEEELDADAVVVAVPHAAAAKLLDPLALPEADRWSRLSSAPIVNVHVHYDRPVTDLEFAAAIDSPVQWVFDRTAAAGIDQGQYLVVSLSAAHEYLTARTKDLRERFLPALRDLFPRAHRAEVLDFFVTREPAATFLPKPGVRALRPETRTGVPGLVLAGAWTDTGWPDTLEGAVSSGHRAAEIVDLATSTDYRVAWR
ncbi:squalene-associated FAD-dependent desaturase [Halopolyspora algeriensis]|uniref:Squalene-associated FAD-dependent desaturase n=1 Tax=Halopolyspora algeriensis TaxID=1500506 RepID=A0A368VVQ6_9ACTN|nr:hydroxysqualene dehydroxylase HpnE [Halopolyspora algeriensis]RCW46184.1 squalene-associated FAD-dependent desaturase [Halopolyspora algeriensis]TQM55587.1 squalene-associated FAD-dependent desaturase [Halopolyspora algeriensis]